MSGHSTIVKDLKELKNEVALLNEPGNDSLKNIEKVIDHMTKLVTNSTAFDFTKNPKEDETKAFKDLLDELDRQSQKARSNFQNSLQKPAYFSENMSNVDSS
uniref:Uncharacterized protein n=1 Tax=Panagrolaimus sp. JU765 TaxID=591449 RepID=A0AC34PZG5_9BILA